MLYVYIPPFALDKVKNMLTPRKGRGSSSGGSDFAGSTPAIVTGKALCNVSTTSQTNPDDVLNQLATALGTKGIRCQQKGYILRGKIRDASGFAKLWVADEDAGKALALVEEYERGAFQIADDEPADDAD